MKIELGLKVGRLTVLYKTDIRSKSSYDYKWHCVCECGNEKDIYGAHLRRKNTRSCGCYRKETSYELAKNMDHTVCGRRKIRTRDRLYFIWCGMKSRCRNPNNCGYKYYGGKGVKVCQEWQDYNPFRDWSLANGYADNLTIDRINSDGNYEPNNCQWITRAENTRRRKGMKYKINK